MARSSSVVTLALVLAPLAQAGQGTQTAFYSRPDIHGDMVVFTAEGDLWLGSVSSGQAKRITSDPGLETTAHFSPDGTMLAFTANYDRGTDVYVMPVKGGSPKRLTYDPVGAGTLGWTADGQRVIFRSSRQQPFPDERGLYSVSVKGGLATKQPVPSAEFAAFRADGKALAYVPGSAEWMNWFRYKGGEADDIWLTDLSGKTFKKLTDNPGIDTAPCWLGNSIVFASERGTEISNLYEINPESGATKALTTFTDLPVRYPASDGKRVVFQKGPSIWMYEASSGVKQLGFEMNSDRIHAREHPVTVATTYREFAFGPTGKRIVLECQGQLISVAAENGDSRVLEADSSGRAMHPAWSLDGKTVAFVSDKGGEEQIYTVPALGGTPKKLTTDLKGEHFPPVWSPDGKNLLIGDREMRIQLVNATTGAVKLIDQSDRTSSYDTPNADYTFSPDGKWVAYARMEITWTPGVHLYEIATSKDHPLTDVAVNSSGPSFDPTGKYLYFLQERELTPTYSSMAGTLGLTAPTKVTCLPLANDTPSPFAPKNEEEGVKADEPKEEKDEKALPTVKVDLDGMSRRMVDVPVEASDFTEVDAIAGKLILVDPTSADALEGAGGTSAVTVFDIDTKKSASLSDSATGIEVSDDGLKVLIQKGKALQVIDATGAAGAAEAATTGTVSLAGITVQVDPVLMWKEAFEEAWRIGRDFFYDPNMHGVDWAGVRKKYEVQLPLVADRSDLNRVIGSMISELNVGHAYVSGTSGYAVPRQPMGFLGVDLSLDPSGHAYKITKMMEGDPFDLENRSPLWQPGLGVKVGDYILEIGGRPVRADQDPQALLIGTQGHTITIKVNTKPSADGARTIRVVPAASENEMRYEDWVESRRAYVAKASGGQLGYVHMSDMESAGFKGYVKGYFQAVEKPGIIFDDRFNGGGSISANILSQLAAHAQGFFKPRYGLSWAREGWAPLGYVVALTNEWAFSDGELFAEYFKRLKIGPLIGTRTGGGEVGSGGGYELVDGGTVFIPNYGAWTEEGKWIIEGTGVVPDIEIHQDPALLMQGKDPQLDKAIQVAMDHLKAHPFRRPTPPPFPVKVGRGG